MEETKVRLVPKEVWFELKDVEIVERARRVAEIRKEVDAVKEEAKGVASDFKGRINVLESEQKALLQTVRANGEHRTVECEFRKDFAANKVEYLFDGKVVEERAMNWEERQAEMDLVRDGADPGPDEDQGGDVIQGDFAKEAAPAEPAAPVPPQEGAPA